MWTKESRSIDLSFLTDRATMRIMAFVIFMNNRLVNQHGVYLFYSSSGFKYYFYFSCIRGVRRSLTGAEAKGIADKNAPRSTRNEGPFSFYMNNSVAFQGEMGAFSSAAARDLLGDEIQLVACETFEKMFAAVESESCDYCLAPIENSL